MLLRHRVPHFPQTLCLSSQNKTFTPLHINSIKQSGTEKKNDIQHINESNTKYEQEWRYFMRYFEIITRPVTENFLTSIIQTDPIQTRSVDSGDVRCGWYWESWTGVQRPGGGLADRTELHGSLAQPHPRSTASPQVSRKTKRAKLTLRGKYGCLFGCPKDSDGGGELG